jgi:hypothetical protein
MHKKYLIFGLFFCILAMPVLFGATVSCLVIETGLPSEGSGSQYSKMWENNLMDVFFDKGHIVSNGRMVRIDQKPEDNFPIEAERDYEEAKENGMDYFLIAIIEHPDRNEAAKPQAVYLRLFSTKSQDMIKEQVYSDNKPRNAKEENDSIKRAIGLIAAQVR